MSHELLSSERQGLLGLIGSLACGALALNKPATLTTLHITPNRAQQVLFISCTSFFLRNASSEAGSCGQAFGAASPWVKLKAAAWRCSRAGRQARYE